MAESSCRWITMLAMPLLILLGISVVCEALHRSRDADSYSDFARSPHVSFNAGGPGSPVAVDTTTATPALYHMTPDVVVAADGTGNYRTIADAVRGAPSRSAKRFVIRIKAGQYRENVVVPREKTKIAFVGDGNNRTVLTSDRSEHGGWHISLSPTLAVIGSGFVAWDLTIENSAGPSGGQAVALRSSSDRSAFYRCNIIGYQDTLYAQSGYQFFRECNVYGTIDFIFGNAAVVLQSCKLFARRPLPGQGITFTAQGREGSGTLTGTVIHNCVLAADDDLRPVEESVRGFLGRPWQRYSTVVVMQSELGGMIDPAGWLSWNGEARLDTVSYGEYDNRGPGADTSRRVNWPGFRVLTNPAEVERFTVSSFIHGDTWLPSTGVPYNGGLL
ncbi:hypothetical protein Taro_012092 [Colocasia esculenta]|uniref:Pectinesterase n=1 Tax=Colocasia esculenta TaxID=4460 RepID=A0A843UCK7_COLES|nr:hypothetical protein [Colocasia esculenta]